MWRKRDKTITFELKERTVRSLDLRDRFVRSSVAT